ncbi:hypothetical protein C8P67_104107 [Flavobacterium aquicola]|uniref:Uncharacterized protein n=1 Tax=Flavobacterium aquicola TaxID=1682742 RepID=A0A3E0EQ46_9FLAO|nr:hypothetical protein C8P67_104107 [Flavobacterium aquicola]
MQIDIILLYMIFLYVFTYKNVVFNFCNYYTIFFIDVNLESIVSFNLSNYSLFFANGLNIRP